MVRQQYTILAGALMSALVIIPVALYFVLGTTEGALRMPPLLLVAAPLVAGVAVHALLEAVGYRTAAITPGTSEEEARRSALVEYQSAMVRRLALSEAIALVSVALGFVVSEGGYVLVLLGCATSLVLMAVHIWPGARPVNKTVASLERDGAQSRLGEAFGMETRPGGAIQAL
ncbi:MAG: hypothetical protein ACXWDM_04485 [Nocardioides sp.]